MLLPTPPDAPGDTRMMLSTMFPQKKKRSRVELPLEGGEEKRNKVELPSLFGAEGAQLLERLEGGEEKRNKVELPPLFGAEGAQLLERLPSVWSDGTAEGVLEGGFGTELRVVEPRFSGFQEERWENLLDRMCAYEAERVRVERTDSRVVQGPCFVKRTSEGGLYVQIGEGTVTESVYGEGVIARIWPVPPCKVGQKVVVFNDDWSVKHGEVCGDAANDLRIRMEQSCGLYTDSRGEVERRRVGVVVQPRKRARA